MKVFFIGAGPGDPDLMTVKAVKTIEQCPIIMYAGSLIPMQVIDSVKDKAEAIYDTASMNLDETTAVIEQAAREGKSVARLQSGDPALYGATGEQMRRLDVLNIDYEVIPGVSAVAASAALLKKELTLSGVSQTVIMTRYEGKTPFPERERLPALAQSGATLAIHLGITRIHKIVDELIPHYGEDCPVAVCYRTSWPDQGYVTGTLKDIVHKVREKKFTRTSLILVGHVLDTEDFADSYLYDKSQAHIYRKIHKNKSEG
ncbi:precorrin-4 C(11)-methyltransferase [Marinomonas mediterranea]|uniref:precorrin-4 C(11)-methyltransferase n=1 Tax=Marinomonas mediterranea TaxID=119864 RepID=UPI00234AA9C9|nr:precorrin-4 C(11)-methyltransferase [Marinomonas mediterranea]WCN08597.1 precorrin-4 C(11)-methyltransferase [Marinomonas mediterranea]WCN12651.1 precorrin-4 C(11)-methyltransferase [Marinomonas mediterranea]